MKYSKIIALSICILSITQLDAQLGTPISEGRIEYNRSQDWISIMSKLSYMSSEEVDRSKLVWGNDKGDGTNYILTFKDNKTVYQKKEEEEDGSYSWRQREHIIIRDYNSMKKKDLIEEVGTKLLVEDELQKPKWKILNEIKEIEGYLCMKAETQDTIKDQTIHAWFTDGISMQGGPEGFGGLPGMILELDINEGDAVITATRIDLESEVEKLPIPKKMKGKNMNQEEYNKLIAKFIKQSIEGRKNPYWRIRY